MTPRRITVLLTMCLTLATAAMAATITGVVRDTSGDPVRRTIVTLNGGALPNGRSAVTDDAGRFTIENVPDGEFTVEASRPGFLKSMYGATRPGRPGTPIAVRGNSAVPEITIVLTHGSALGGVMRDTAGDPAPGMRIEAIRIVHLAAGDRAEKLGTAQTDDRGEFRIFGLPAGDYVLAATPNVIIGGLGSVGAPTEAEVDAKLNALRSRSQMPAPGAPAKSPNANTPQQRGVNMPATFYPGVINPAEAVTVSLGTNDTREGLDFARRVSTAATVKGVIASTQGAVPQVLVGIQGNGPQLPVFGGSAGGPSVRTDNGAHTFEISNVPPGHYRLNARTMNAPGNTTQLMSSGGVLPKVDTSGVVMWGSVEFDVSGDDLDGVTITLSPAPTVRGRVVMDPSATRPLASVAGMRASLTPVADSDRRSNGLSGPIVGVVAADGSLELPSVIPGTYRVSLAAPNGWWLRSAVVGAGGDVLDGTLTVDAGGVTDLVMTTSDRHSSVGGTLTTAGGPATDYFLVAFTADKNLWRAPSRRVRSARPTTNGAFEIADLPPGEYYLAALKDLDALDLEDPAFLDTLIPASASVTIVEGQKTVQDLLVGRSGSQLRRVVELTHAFPLDSAVRPRYFSRLGRERRVSRAGGERHAAGDGRRWRV